MPWNNMQILVTGNAADPAYGLGGLSREQARAEVENQLRRAVNELGLSRQMLDTWVGDPDGDTVAWAIGRDQLIYCVYEYESDMRAGATDWFLNSASRFPGMPVFVKTPAGGFVRAQ